MRQIPDVWRSNALGLGDNHQLREVDRKTDLDGSTALNRSWSLDPRYYLLYLDFVVVNKSGGTKDLKLTIDGLGAGKYNYTVTDETNAFTGYDSQDYIKVASVADDWTVSGRLTIQAGTLESETSQFFVSGEVQNSEALESLHIGRVAATGDGGESISSISLKMGSGAKMKAVLLGEYF